ncbi:manganese efflux pump MntP family protein [Kineococcus rhizosphaerae]|uniref:manganese efflux pump MntP n=1 Tax=Kineococcus rhizosphaerae TaxID=559628 RepID=UPI000D082830|nr:manganese efflux pump MntP family protein [Kineococcus rhizosphaerae]
MSVWTLLVIAVGVSADAFAVALGKGLHLRRLTARTAVSLAVAFGFFQGVMPLAGWALARGFRGWITSIDHWVAFALLVLIGGKMLWEAFSSGEDDEEDRDGGIGLRELLVLSVATSVDALAVGISFAFLDVAIVPAAVAIGVTTGVITLVGVLVGHRVGARFGKPAEVLGGLVLIGIGTRILLDHTGVL